jgi:hypothetical protein
MSSAEYTMRTSLKTGSYRDLGPACDWFYLSCAHYIRRSGFSPEFKYLFFSWFLCDFHQSYFPPILHSEVNNSAPIFPCQRQARLLGYQKACTTRTFVLQSQRDSEVYWRAEYIRSPWYLHGRLIKIQGSSSVDSLFSFFQVSLFLGRASFENFALVPDSEITWHL